MSGDDKAKKSDSEEAGWQYNSDSPVDKDQAALAALPETDGYLKSNPEAVEWSASEFVAHEKGFGWYAVLVLVASVVITGVYFATRDPFSATVVAVMALILGVAASRKPRVITYRLDNTGLTAGKKFYPYSAYKSFVIPDDGPFISIMMQPMRRLDLPVGAFLAPDSQQKALEVISAHLPLERGEPGLLDILMRQLRF